MKREMSMVRYFVTGVGGFVGRHLCCYLLKSMPQCRILGIGDSLVSKIKDNRITYIELDLNDIEELSEQIQRFLPDVIIHLAAISSVGRSWQIPAETFKNNTGIYLNVLETVRKYVPKARILSIGSSEVYGTWPETEMPLSEEHELRPESPYAIARLAQEQLSKLYVENYGLDIVQSRSFNHIGPGQDKRFAIPSFISQLISIVKRKQGTAMKVGNIDVIRDFLDVRDVVRAYLSIIENGKTGEIYNVCSGIGRKLRDVINSASQILGITPYIEIDKSLIRKNDALCIVGKNVKVVSLGWKPVYSFHQTVSDMIDFLGEIN